MVCRVEVADVHSSGAVIARLTDQGPVFLLLRYGQGHWDFVKGHIESGESEEETLHRETKEETGLTDLKIVPGFRRVIRYSYRHKGRRVQKQVVFRLALTQQEQITLSHEHTGSIWLSRDKALGKVTFDNARRLLSEASTHMEREGLAAAVSDKDRPRG